MAATQENGAAKPTSTPSTASSKLHGREFYESIGKPKFIVAPMVDQSEFVSRVPLRNKFDTHDPRSGLSHDLYPLVPPIIISF
jgi:tRNA-dihydrouridine synthase 1